MGKKYVGEITKTEAQQSPTILANADLMKAVASNDVRDNKWTFQFAMTAGSAVFAVKGPAGVFTNYRINILDTDQVVILDDEAYPEFRVTWTGTGGTGSVSVRGEERS